MEPVLRPNTTCAGDDSADVAVAAHALDVPITAKLLLTETEEPGMGLRHRSLLATRGAQLTRSSTPNPKGLADTQRCPTRTAHPTFIASRLPQLIPTQERLNNLHPPYLLRLGKSLPARMALSATTTLARHLCTKQPSASPHDVHVRMKSMHTCSPCTCVSRP